MISSGNKSGTAVYARLMHNLKQLERTPGNEERRQEVREYC
jgi:hypothetical protein